MKIGRKFLVLGLVVFLLAASVSAITGSIGNARMVLRLEKGETIEKYILVKNINDVPVTVSLNVVGDLADDVELRDESFVLNAGAEKKAYFTLKATSDETTETKINIKFVPEDGSTVGLSSTIIVLVSGDEETDEEPEEETNEPEEIIGEEVEQSEGSQVGFGIGEGSAGAEGGGDTKIELSPEMILLISTLVLIVIFVLIIIYGKRLNGKKEAGRKRG